MVDVTTSISIAHPRVKVAEYASDPDNAPRWYVNIKSVDWITAKPLRVGSQIAFQAMFLGRTLKYVYEVIEYVHCEKLVMRTSSGPFLMETAYAWETLDESTTRMTLRNRGFPSGFSKLVAPFMSLAMRRANSNDLRRLKELLEGRRR